MDSDDMDHIDPSLGLDVNSGNGGMQQPSPVTQGPPFENALFLERLEAFYEKSLADLRVFAQREGCPYDEVCLPRPCSSSRVAVIKCTRSEDISGNGTVSPSLARQLPIPTSRERTKK